MQRFWSKVDVKDEDHCWVWKNKCQAYYPQFWYEGKMILTHRMAYALHYDRMDLIENKSNDYHKNNNNFSCVLHSCDNPKCCNPHHLFLGTNKDNILDKVNKNRSQRMRGSINGNSKLTKDQVLCIRNEYVPRKNGGLAYFAKKYGISTTQVHDIIQNKTWKHI